MEVLFSTDVLLWLFVLSIAGFVASLIAIPFILVKLPADYFDERRPRKWMENHHPILRLTGRLIKNAMGVVLLLAGIAMLFLPGQGVLTILIGISMVDFPGKRALERRLISQPAVLQTINKLRAKFRHPPLIMGPDS